MTRTYPCHGCGKPTPLAERQACADLFRDANHGAHIAAAILARTEELE